MNYGLIGKTLKHSYSKLIHEHLLDNYIYELHPLTDLETFFAKREFKAINVTIPYKQDVIPYLDWIHPNAKKINAVNTIVNKNGKLYGYNTDYYGFYYTLQKHHIEICNKQVLILGDGGASQAVQAVVQDLHAKTIHVANRTPKPNTISFEQAKQLSKEIDVIINTTPVGMYPDVDKSCMDLSPFIHCTAFVDCIYNPLETKQALQAKQLKIPTVVTGLEMLVAQAVKALEYFKDIEFDEKIIDEVYQWLLSKV